jgi:hypothetical protein
MKVYDNLDVDMSYQNFGSSWLIVLRGATEQIESAFNGLFNFCATNGQLTYQDHLQTVATFWSSEEAMDNFFFQKCLNQRVLSSVDKGVRGGSAGPADAYAIAQLATLKTTSENFMDFTRDAYMPETYGLGKITAENPDNDMKDAILSHAMKDKSSDVKNDLTEAQD